ncbi:transglycosylase SLT domain-containing protein [Novispirillum itersonii]|uniref:Transglycosylase SLT domain-containing protein n=1 Tax=Novispirillum itersonii TaxID=189 RepID=A0A7W9ZCD3_NOVIT|nr:transglycosylase SLT domain-containing protein [Novispirillum itersonii]MBB6208780.1 hypothetical protein [Novispirillum itersonii]
MLTRTAPHRPLRPRLIRQATGVAVALLTVAAMLSPATAAPLTNTPQAAASRQAVAAASTQPRFFDLPARPGVPTPVQSPPLPRAAPALSAAANAPATPDGGLGPDGVLCRRETERQERQAGFPRNLLTALSHVESGRWDDAREAKVAWPWTVMAEGRGRYFRTKAEAISEVRGLQARGVKNIDVGCMQINLMYHGDAFDSLEQAFDPAANVGYAVEFLTNLYEETGAWTRAATRYHSATEVHAIRYSGVLAKEWTRLNRDTGTALTTAELATGNRPVAMPAALPLPAQRQPILSVKPLFTPAQLAALEQQRQKMESLRAQQDQQRQVAKTYAENWRAQKMQEYLQARRGSTVQTAAD